jgi:DNA processing protein
MTGATDGACRECVRRSWLLSKLSARLDYSSRDAHRLLELLALDDEQLIAAIAGRWRGDLTERWERFEVDELNAAPDVETVCEHGRDFPHALRDRAGAPSDRIGLPRMLHVVGGVDRLAALTSGRTVAIVGTRRPTDYGMEMARSLARGLAASGVTVLSGLANGIAAAAHAGALEADGPTATVMAGGVDVVKPASRRSLYERVTASGCAVAELPCGFQERRWCDPARARTVAELATLTIVVEADEGPHELIGARAARALGRTVAAVPGRVTSPVSRGSNGLLMSGAPMVRGPGDALDLLYGLVAHDLGAPGPARLEPRLQAMLEQVGAGRDTPGKLTSHGEDPHETMLALSELELMGLLGRGDGGRYVPRESLAGRSGA